MFSRMFLLKKIMSEESRDVGINDGCKLDLEESTLFLVL